MVRRASGLLFTFASAASLVLCVATVVLWVRSYGPSFDMIGYRHRGGDGEMIHQLSGGRGAHPVAVAEVGRLGEPTLINLLKGLVRCAARGRATG